MLDNLPIYISVIFALTTFATLLLFYWAVKKSSSLATSKNAIIIGFGLVIWLIIQVVLTLQNVYSSGITFIPPKILIFGIMPAFATIALLFTTQNGRSFIDSLPLLNITYLNIVRIPVEIVLYCLFVNKAVPQLMTFEGRNFDILAGITAPLVAYFGFKKGKLSKRLIIIWNFICLVLLLNIVINALLSAPSPLQQFAFNQPNIAILYFPFSWLPTFIVPIVLFGHLVSIRQLLKQ